MTSEEMFQLLMKEIKAGQARLEAKVDANHKEVTEKLDDAIADIKEIKQEVHSLWTCSEIDSQSINGAYNGIKELNVKFDKLTTEFNHQRRFMQKAVGDLSSDVQGLDERVGQLEKEKKAS